MTGAWKGEVVAFLDDGFVARDASGELWKLDGVQLANVRLGFSMEEGVVERELPVSWTHERALTGSEWIRVRGDTVKLLRRRDIDCPVCGHLACVCATVRDHDEGCPYRRAVTCAAAIECEHGYNVCPRCDPCTCERSHGG